MITKTTKTKVPNRVKIVQEGILQKLSKHTFRGPKAPDKILRV
jgi:hypothetical protein